MEDLLFINPLKFNLKIITDRLNNIEPSMKVTYELESNNTF